MGLVFFLLLSFTAMAADELPMASPLAVWNGEAFIEEAVSAAKREKPDLKLSTGADQYLLKVYNDAGNDRVGRYQKKFPGKPFIPGRAQDSLLLLKLYNGQEISIVGKSNRPSYLLQDWMRKQGNRSVLPHQLLARALIYNDGNTLFALTDIWNLLNKDWRAAGTRNANPITQRLFDVTGEFDLRDGPGHFVIVDAHSPGIAIKNRIEFLVTKRGDVFSTYYHYFGSMLFSHYLAAKTGRESVGRLAGTAAVKFEGKLHRATSGLAREREKRILNDIEGANAGAKLKTAVTNPEKIGTPAENKGIPASYLKPDARIKESYLLEADGRAPIQYGKKEFTRGGMTLEELKLRFQYALEVSKDIFDPVILATSSDGERLQVGLDKYIKSGAKDQELNAMIQKFSSWGGKQRSAADSYDFSLDLNLNNQHLWGEQGTYDLEMSRKRADRLMKLILDMNQLPLLPALPTKSAPEGKCMRLFALIFDGLARPTRGKK